MFLIKKFLQYEWRKANARYFKNEVLKSHKHLFNEEQKDD
jgi:hypothetical protein